MIYLSSLLITFILSYATITWLIMPVLTRYQSLARLINHFDYTTLTLKADPRTIQEAVLNIIYFIPLGGLYCINTDFKQFVIVSLVTLLVIETIQFIFYLGTFAISDIILNFLGCLIGYYCCWEIKRRLS